MNEYSRAINVYFDELAGEIEQYKNNKYNYHYKDTKCYSDGFWKFYKLIKSKYTNDYLTVTARYEEMSGSSKHINPYLLIKYYDHKLQDGLYIYIKFPPIPNDKWIKVSLELGRTLRYSDKQDIYELNLKKLYEKFETEIEEASEKIHYCEGISSLGQFNNLIEGFLYDYEKLDDVLDSLMELYNIIMKELRITNWETDWEKVQSDLFGDSYISNTSDINNIDNKEEKYNILDSKLTELIDNYINDFDSYFPEEIYKWKAIKTFNDNWNLNVDDDSFSEMLKKSLKESANILTAYNYYPYGMIVELSEKDPSIVKNMFEVLFDESKDLYSRIQYFVEKADELLSKHYNNDRKHYQNMHAISTYLGFRYPEKYYLFKSGVDKKALNYLNININDQDKINELINYFTACDEIHSHLLLEDELKELLSSALDDKCYLDDNYHILTWDFLYYAGRVYLTKNESNEELNRIWTYSPGENGFCWDYCYDNNKMVIGWDELGDLSDLSTRDEIAESIKKTYGKENPYNDISCVDDFYNKIKTGDIIIAKIGMTKLLGYGVVTDDSYLYDESREMYKHTRNVKWKKKGIWNLPDNLKVAQKTLTDITNYDDFGKKLLSLMDGKGMNNKYTEKDFTKEVFIDEKEYNTLKSLLLKKKNLILEGSPGVGKTFMAKRLAYSIIGERDNSKILSLQFHQSYSYEDFIEGIRPDEDGNGKFKLIDGIFKDFVNNKVLSDPNPDNKYFVIIDEINRGNLSKIFGELMKLIECDKRYDPNLPEDYEYVILPYSKKEFKIPKNLYIIGTMNTADRSLAMVDYALRRRFVFYHVYPAFAKDEFKNWLRDKNEISEKNINELCSKYIKLNESIKTDLGKGFEIGHSYFVDTLTEEDFDKIYNNIVKYEIEPLLNEYWFDDDKKVDEYKKIIE